RTARRRTAAARQPARSAGHPQLSHLPLVVGRDQGAGRVCQGGLAAQHPAPLLTYHIMVGLSTILIAVLAVATGLLLQRTLYATRWMLWILLLLPFSYIAHTAG